MSNGNKLNGSVAHLLLRELFQSNKSQCLTAYVACRLIKILSVCEIHKLYYSILKFCVSMHHSISQMKHQLDATLCRFYFCRITLHVSGASAHHQEYLKLVQRPLCTCVIVGGKSSHLLIRDLYITCGRAVNTVRS